MYDLKVIIIVAFSAILLFSICGLFFASIFRRVHHKRKYGHLDRLRSFYGGKIIADLDAGKEVIELEDFRTTPGSLEWQAVEDVLFPLMDDERYKFEIKRLFYGLGYVSFYEEQLQSRNRIIKESAINKLGRMENEAPIAKLLPLLDDSDPQLLSVTVRALSKIDSKEGLRGVVDKLPVLLRQSLVARKMVETALLNFGPAAVPVLIEEHGESADPLVVSCVLNTLSHFPPDTRAVFLAIERLNDPDAEVRSRALRVLARAEKNIPDHLPSLIVPMLSDPVWFVRLQASKAAGALRCEQAAMPVGKLLFDSNWQVRKGAALTLTELGDCAVDVFLDALTHDDAYAKEGICGALDKADFTGRLIELLKSQDRTMREKARQILTIMRAAGFSARLSAYLKTETDDHTRMVLQGVLEEGPGR